MRGYFLFFGVVNGFSGVVRGCGIGNVFMDLRLNGCGGWVGMDKGK